MRKLDSVQTDCKTSLPKLMIRTCTVFQEMVKSPVQLMIRPPSQAIERKISHSVPSDDETPPHIEGMISHSIPRDGKVYHPLKGKTPTSMPQNVKSPTVLK